jgi:hypothetical protein
VISRRADASVSRRRIVPNGASTKWGRPRTALILIIAVALSPMPAAGQRAGGGNHSVRSFWVTEAGYSYSMTGGCSDHYPSFELGRLVNLGGSFAAGGSAFLGHNGDLLFGPMPRLRYWASDDVALDLGAGLLVGARRSRPAGLASVNYRDMVSLVVQYERNRDGACGPLIENQVFLGAKIGSRPGVKTALVGTAIAGVLILYFVSQVEN